jgi:hypothetical protein
MSLLDHYSLVRLHLADLRADADRERLALAARAGSDRRRPAPRVPVGPLFRRAAARLLRHRESVAAVA